MLLWTDQQQRSADTCYQGRCAACRCRSQAVLRSRASQPGQHSGCMEVGGCLPCGGVVRAPV